MFFEIWPMNALLIKLVPNWITPNTLTSARLLGSLVLLGLGFSDISLGWLILLMAALIMSDAFDGWLARGRGQVTALGAYLDPMADKLFAFVVAVVLWSRGLVDLKLLILALLVDLHVWLLPFLIWRRRVRLKLKLWPPPLVTANAWGKFKTGVLSAAMGFIILGAYLDSAIISEIGLAGIIASIFLGLMASLGYMSAWSKGAYL